MFVSVPVGYTVVLVAVVELPASFASEQPSLSESKSKWFVIPSLSVSKGWQLKYPTPFSVTPASYQNWLEPKATLLSYPIVKLVEVLVAVNVTERKPVPVK